MASITPTEQELQFLEALRTNRRKNRHVTVDKVPILDEKKPALSLGQQISDVIARTVGSWRFIILQSICILGWIAFNSTHRASEWDPYPYILLNLMLSFQAAYTAPVIMMSQNRLSEIDRLQANQDFDINVKAELEIELLHQKIDLLKEQEVFALTRAIEAIGSKLDRINQTPTTIKG
jgi:uncharacterized membrane protein